MAASRSDQATKLKPMKAGISSDMQPIIETANLGPVSISKHVIKHFRRLCDDDFDEGAKWLRALLKARISSA